MEKQQLTTGATKVPNSIIVFASVLLCVIPGVWQRKPESAVSTDSFPLNNKLAIQRSACASCQYFRKYDESVDWKQHAPFVYSIRSTLGTGRSGNVVYQLWKVVLHMYACKGILIMPGKDALDAFPIVKEHRVLDFRSRLGPVDPKCYNHEPFLDAENLGPVNFMPHPTWDFLHMSDTGRILESLADCLRLYYGFCNTDYCTQVDDSYDDDLLVLHIRQGDIYPSQYGHTTWSGMGQPPLSYYLSAISYRKWSKIVVLGEPTELKSPIWLELEMLQATRIVNITFGSTRSVADDFRLMLCSPSLVVSHSSVNMLLALGFTRRWFHYAYCFGGLHTNEVIKIPIAHDFVPIVNHTNSPEQWVESLLGKVGEPMLCGPAGPFIFLT